MNKNRKADATNIGSKTDDYFADNQKAFSSSDYSGELESVQSIIEGMILPKPKVIRCFRCLACGESYSLSRMSSLLIVCRHCYNQTDSKGKIARRNQIERIKNQVGIFLKQRIETI